MKVRLETVEGKLVNAELEINWLGAPPQVIDFPNIKYVRVPDVISPPTYREAKGVYKHPVNQ